MKEQWWYCIENGMIGKYRRDPGVGWRGPYRSIRDLKEANTKPLFSNPSSQYLAGGKTWTDIQHEEREQND